MQWSCTINIKQLLLSNTTRIPSTTRPRQHQWHPVNIAIELRVPGNYREHRGWRAQRSPSQVKRVMPFHSAARLSSPHDTPSSNTTRTRQVTQPTITIELIKAPSKPQETTTANATYISLNLTKVETRPTLSLKPHTAPFKIPPSTHQSNIMPTVCMNLHHG